MSRLAYQHSAIAEKRNQLLNDHAAFSVAHPCGLQIHRGVPEPDVRVVRGVTTRDHGNGYVWYYLPRAEISGQVIGMGLCYFKHRLEFINVGVVDEVEEPGWSKWDPVREQARADAVGRWFADVGYPVGAYPWGSVHAGVDPKTGDGSGTVRYILGTTGA